MIELNLDDETEWRLDYRAAQEGMTREELVNGMLDAMGVCAQPEFKPETSGEADEIEITN